MTSIHCPSKYVVLLVAKDAGLGNTVKALLTPTIRNGSEPEMAMTALHVVFKTGKYLLDKEMVPVLSEIRSCHQVTGASE